MLPLVFLGFVNLFNNRLGASSRILVVLIIGILLLQFIPIGDHKGFPQYTGQISQWKLWSISPSRSLEANLYALSVLGVSLFICRMNTLQHKRLIRFIFLGFSINLLVGIIQLSYGSKIKITGVLPFDISSGVFANENHFSSLVYMIIPLVAWRVLVESWRPLVYFLIVVLIVLFQFSIGSRAGMAMALSLALFSYLWIFLNRIPNKAKVAALVGSIFIAGVGILMFDTSSILEGDYRQIIFATTWLAIQQHLITGTGLGSFVLVYPMYEATKDVQRFYANQAHNDYLQLLLELGLMFIPLFLFFLIQMFRNMFRSGFTQYISISLFAVLLHSIIDYPLRTMAIAIVFGTLLAILFSERDELKVSEKNELR